MAAPLELDLVLIIFDSLVFIIETPKIDEFPGRFNISFDAFQDIWCKYGRQ